MYYKGQRVKRIKYVHPGYNVPVGMTGTIIEGEGKESPRIKWDNGVECHSFLSCLAPVSSNNKGASTLLDKEW
jgi:hypothetical protein